VPSVPSSSAPSDSLFGRLSSNHAAIAAALAATLYLAGITALTVRMHEAGLSIHDTLPLFSLDQLLRVGLTWIYPAVPVLLALTVLYVISTFFERKLGEMTKTFEGQRACQISTGDRQTWKESFTKLRISTDWLAIEPEIRTAINEGQGDPNLKQWKRLRRRITLFAVWTGLIFIALLAACLPLAVTVGIGTAIVLVATAILTGTRPAQQALVPIFAIAVLGVLVNAIISQRPLPHATVTTESSVKKSGDLVVISDGTWYLDDSEGNVLAIPLSRIKSSRIRSRAQPRTLWDLLDSGN
jgi:hypothetical protein